MSRDPYAWMDPWEAVEAERRWGEAQYAAGRESLLRRFEGEAGDMFRRALGLAVEELARVAARDYVMKVAMELRGYQEANDLLERTARRQIELAAPVLRVYRDASEVKISVVPELRDSVDFHVETLRPMRLAFRMSV